MCIYTLCVIHIHIYIYIITSLVVINCLRRADERVRLCTHTLSCAWCFRRSQNLMRSIRQGLRTHLSLITDQTRSALQGSSWKLLSVGCTFDFPERSVPSTKRQQPVRILLLSLVRRDAKLASALMAFCQRRVYSARFARLAAECFRGAKGVPRKGV